MSASRLARIEEAVSGAIARKELPGAVVLVGRGDRVVLRKAYGSRAVVPELETMTVDTAFDLASVTKVVATATSVMVLVEQGKVRLVDPVVKHLPEFGREGGREKVTVEQLLTHRAGLVADDPMELYRGTPDEIRARKGKVPLANPPGQKFVYSDAGYEALGEMVERVSGKPLDVFAREFIFAKLGMKETEFRPAGKGMISLARIAPTEKVDGRILRGEVHDPRARAVGGVAGHAGLFGTADDLARYCQAILAGGGPVLSKGGVAEMTRPRFFGDADLRALGWDVETSYSTNRGDLLPRGSFGHTGWTGTSIWIDPVTRIYVVLLTSRVHPDGSGTSPIALRGIVATLAAAAVSDVDAAKLRDASATTVLLAAAGRRAAASQPAAVSGGPSPAASAPVRSGLDVLADGGFKEIEGKRLALLTNQTGRASDGRSAAAVLMSVEAKKAGVALVRLFSPEHGPVGALDEKVGDSTDAATGLPVRSLYGENRRPAPADLEGIDAVVVDLQDAGARFYTFLTTLGYVMEEAAKAKVKVVVLDRPDPIRADMVEGPPADEEKRSFVAYHSIPVRTGMTIGELAGLFNAERKIGADLAVVKMKRYRRSLWHDETGLAWVNPSPNLRSVTQAALYPGIALLETTNVSVGRGTDAPFEWVGAPWLDGGKLGPVLSARGIPGVRFTPVRFTPASSKHAGIDCGGVRITVVDRDHLAPVALGIELITALRDLYPREWDRSRLGDLIANGATLTRIERGDAAAAIVSGWAAAQMEFERRRAGFLLYD
jgi:uncharacterized protein YbbC (DUF1343 family)/CubicO group peptidase (beta-lactamase class C family)